jgi:predicted RNase H-like HicB family nuclease
MIRDFEIVVECNGEGHYVATVPSLRGCHTQANSLDALMERVREAIELCLEAEEDAEDLAALEERQHEPNLAFEDVVSELRLRTPARA